MNSLTLLMMFAAGLPQWNAVPARECKVHVELLHPRSAEFASSLHQLPVSLLPGDPPVCVGVLLQGVVVREGESFPDLRALGVRPLIMPVEPDVMSPWAMIGESANYHELSDADAFSINLTPLSSDDERWPRLAVDKPAEDVSMGEMCVSARSDERVAAWVVLGLPAQALKPPPPEGSEPDPTGDVLVAFSSPMLFGAGVSKLPEPSPERSMIARSGRAHSVPFASAMQRRH